MPCMFSCMFSCLFSCMFPCMFSCMFSCLFSCMFCCMGSWPLLVALRGILLVGPLGVLLRFMFCVPPMFFPVMPLDLQHRCFFFLCSQVRVRPLMVSFSVSCTVVSCMVSC